MATTNVLGAVYETLLCSPGMSELVKIDVKISRKAVLLLNSVIEAGVDKGNETFLELVKLVPKEDIDELKTFAEESLKKAGLKELSEKMSNLYQKQ